MWGPLHGGANVEVIEMLERIHQGGLSPEDCIRDAKDKTNPFRLYGFGHRIYQNYDPRAKILKEACDKVFAQLKRADPLLDIARKLEELALDDPYFVERKLYPNVDFYSGIILRAMGIPDEHVHGLLRHRPAAGLDRPVEGAARRSDEQDPPPAADLHRPDEDGLRADEEPVSGSRRVTPPLRTSQPRQGRQSIAEGRQPWGGRFRSSGREHAKFLTTGFRLAKVWVRSYVTPKEDSPIFVERKSGQSPPPPKCTRPSTLETPMNARRLAVALSKWSLTFAFLLSAAAAPAQPAEAPKLSDEQIARGYRLDEVAAGVWRIRFGEPEKLTPVTFQEHPARQQDLAALAPCGQLPLKIEAIGFRRSGRGTGIELPLEEDEHLYGLGMNLKVFQLRGGKKVVRVSDDQTTVLGDSHAPAPFYVSTRGYGVYVDTARYASFYFADLGAVREGLAESNAAAPGADRALPLAAAHAAFCGRRCPLGARRGRVSLRRSRHVPCRAALQPVFRGRVLAADVGPGRVVSCRDLFEAAGSAQLPPRVPPAAHSLRRVRAGARLAHHRLSVLVRLEPGELSRPRRAAARDARAGLQAEPLGTLLYASRFAALQAVGAVERRLQGLERPGARFRLAPGPQDLHRPPRQDAGRPGRQRLQARRVRSSAHQRRTPGPSRSRRCSPPGWTASRCTC